MSIEIPRLNAHELQDTGGEPIVLHVPADNDSSILVNCNPRRAPHQLEIAVHKHANGVQVARVDQERIQVVDAEPLPSQPHIRPYLFEEPLSSVDFRFDENVGIWRYERSEDIANTSLLNKFAYLVGVFAVTRQMQQARQAASDARRLH